MFTIPPVGAGFNRSSATNFCSVQNLPGSPQPLHYGFLVRQKAKRVTPRPPGKGLESLLTCLCPVSTFPFIGNRERPETHLLKPSSPLWENEIDYLEHGIQPVWQLGTRRNFVRSARLADLRLHTHDALCDCGCCAEEGSRRGPFLH